MATAGHAAGLTDTDILIDAARGVADAGAFLKWHPWHSHHPHGHDSGGDRRSADPRLTIEIAARLNEYLSPYWTPEAWEKEKSVKPVTDAILRALENCKEFIAKFYSVPEDSLTCFHKGCSEWLLDFVWTTYPCHPSNIGPRFSLASDKNELPPHEILFGAECEHGKEGKAGSAQKNCEMVVGDFWKLLDVKARFKLMIYRGPVDRQSREDGFDMEGIRARFERLLQQHVRDLRDDWLFLGIPWTKYAPWSPQWHVVSHDENAQPTLVPFDLQEALDKSRISTTNTIETEFFRT